MPPCHLLQATDRSLAECSDDELMTLAQAGLHEPFAMLVERHGLRVVQACARLLGDGALGVELAQEVWVALWLQRAQYRGDGRFVVWLITAARNRCRNRLRERRIADRYVRNTAGLAPDATQPVDQLLLDERRRQVRVALLGVPDRMREALLLRFAEELRYDEMAEVLQTRESTLRSRVHHGLARLRALLEKHR